MARADYSAWNMSELALRQRPRWVWIISGFYFFSAAYALASFYLIYGGWVPLTPPMQEYASSLSAVDAVFMALIGSCNIAAAIALFLLRRSAFHLFAAGLLCSVVHTAWLLLDKAPHGLAQPGPLSYLVSWGLVLAACVYISRLSKAGVLK